MRKMITFLVICIFSFTPMSIFAESTEQTVLAQTNEETKEQYSPISVEQRNINGMEYVFKAYELSPESNPESLKESDFELEGFSFAHLTTEKSIKEKQLTKDVYEEIEIESQGNSLEDILKQLPSVKEYNKNGYSGKIALNTSSIVTEVSGYTTKSYTVSTVKEYPGLMYADPSYVSQTAVKNGSTLPLTNVDWVVMGTGLAGDSLVPTEYKAVATYAKSFTNQVPTGYISTARYEGTVVKSEVDSVFYKVTYAGTAIEKEGIPVVLKVISGLLVVCLLIGSGFVVMLFLKSRKSSDIYNLVDKEYICIGRQAVDAEEPLIDLNEFDDMIQSNSFKIVLDKKTTRKLFGRNISVTLKDVTIKHMVRGRQGEYSFDLDLGGVLDAE